MCHPVITKALPCFSDNGIAEIAGLDNGGLDNDGLDIVGLDNGVLDNNGLDIEGVDIVGLDNGGLDIAGLDIDGLDNDGRMCGQVTELKLQNVQPRFFTRPSMSSPAFSVNP